jgi:hypothetical protein
MLFFFFFPEPDPWPATGGIVSSDKAVGWVEEFGHGIATTGAGISLDGAGARAGFETFVTFSPTI